MPSRATANAERPEEGVVLVGVTIMLDLGGEITASDVLPVERGAFEPREKEGREESIRCRHGTTTHERPQSSGAQQDFPSDKASRTDGHGVMGMTAYRHTHVTRIGEKPVA